MSQSYSMESAQQIPSFARESPLEMIASNVSYESSHQPSSHSSSASPLPQSIFGMDYGTLAQEIKYTSSANEGIFLYASSKKQGQNQNYALGLQNGHIGNILSSSSNNIINSNMTYFQNQNSHNSNNHSYLITSKRIEYHFNPTDFLKPGREGMFVGEVKLIKSHITETFEKMFNKPFPCDIKISVLDKEKFSKVAPGSSTIGLSFNRREHGLLSEIFVLNGSLARVMLTIGHELGHVLTKTLSNAHDEEAKAFAFSIAWMRIIQDNNIADLGASFVLENPAQNGLHNVAFNFVQKLIKEGKVAWEIYLELITGKCFVPIVSPFDI